MNAQVRNDELSASAEVDLVDALQATGRDLLTYLVRQAHASRLGLIEYLILARACDEDGVTARDATRAFDLSTSTMTGISDRLEKDKLVRRHAHPTDRRVLVLKATRRGHGVIERTLGSLVGDVAELASAVDPEQQELLAGVVHQIGERLRQDL